MANSSLIQQSSPLLSAMRAVLKGDFSIRLSVDENGTPGAIAEVFNDIVHLLENATDEFERVGEVVGKQGRIGQRATLPGATGDWARWIDSVNALVAELKDNINAMITNLRLTTERNQEQGWLKTNLNKFTSTYLTILDQLTESIGIVLNNIEATMRTEGLLEQSQKLATELQSQQKELQQTNQELGQKAKQLAEQNSEVERKNQQIEQARHALEEKAAELALTSKYKSEFLANMSHELRTPLNSILILGQQLGQNADGNLTDKQIEFAKTIYVAGTDLLNLISDILDLSKIESGTVTVETEELPYCNLLSALERTFRHEAETRRLAFTVECDPALGQSIQSDSKRLLQVLKNLLSNAFKFTAAGGVSLKIAPVDSGWNPDHPVLKRAARVIAFEVTDTGIGIPVVKQKIIFEAFQQADAGTSRKFGGTGLGLAISRELATLLGGEIRLTSTPGTGSTFTLILPETYLGTPPGQPVERGPTIPTAVSSVIELPRVEEIPDDRLEIGSDDEVLLIIEDDPHFARVLLGLARDKGFKGIVTSHGATGLQLARQFLPTAISLDIFLPDLLGWSVLSQLKHDSANRHIPVQIVTIEEERQHGLAHGAFAYLNKVSTTKSLEIAFDRLHMFGMQRVKRLLIVEDNASEQRISNRLHFCTRTQPKAVLVLEDRSESSTCRSTVSLSTITKSR